MDREKRIDESWKENVAREKEILNHKGEEIIPSAEPQPPEASLKGDNGQGSEEEQPLPEINFLAYLSSLVFQAMIFLGEIPHPLTNEMEKNLTQAKMIIDTLAMLKEKTTGNLTTQESDMLSTGLYELQMKYVEVIQKEGQP